MINLIVLAVVIYFLWDIIFDIFVDFFWLICIIAIILWTFGIM